MKLVLCEGKNDKMVIEGLVLHERLEAISVEDYGGIDKLAAFVRSRIQLQDFVRGEIETIAITTDADASREAAWQKISNIVREVFRIVICAENPILGSQPKIAGFVVGSGNAGMLEDLCLDAYRDAVGFSCLETYFQCLSTVTGIPSYTAKSKFRAWMASQSKTNVGAGIAAKEGLLPFHHPAFDPLRNLLKSL